MIDVLSIFVADLGSSPETYNQRSKNSMNIKRVSFRTVRFVLVVCTFIQDSAIAPLFCCKDLSFNILLANLWPSPCKIPAKINKKSLTGTLIATYIGPSDKKNDERIPLLPHNISLTAYVKEEPSLLWGSAEGHLSIGLSP